MSYYNQPIKTVAEELKVNISKGLTTNGVKENSHRFGYNQISEKKKKSLFAKILDALKEPMLIILMFGFFIALGANIGKYLKTGEGDFVECFGILFAVVLSVTITLVMEGSSQKAFATLNKIYENLTVKVIRDGEVVIVNQKFVTVGDVILIESGDKIVADGRLIESNSLQVDESALTGESLAVKKDANVVLQDNVPLAERQNMVYAGTFVTGGNGKMLVISVGDKTEMGQIAGEISTKEQGASPLQQKLNRLGKTITIIGAICAVLIFIISIIRLIVSGRVTFGGIQELFISCIILIVAAVPEGLPTIVAVSLALNMIKLARENALIKKMTATETAGAVSVICSDKTGTLTQNRMTVTSICTGEFCVTPKKLNDTSLVQNFVLNTTAEVVREGRKIVYKGSGTECALVLAYMENCKRNDYKALRKENSPVHRVPFSSDRKCMLTVINHDGKYRTLIKGAPEKVLSLCSLSQMQKNKIMKEITSRQQNAERILCFAHFDGDGFAQTENDFQGNYLYDGFVSLKDPVRPEVKKAVDDCKRAGIKIKVLTGDNSLTAFAVSRELGIVADQNSVVNASYLEGLTDQELKKILPKISVIARSTPIVKLRVVRALKSMGEVVAVTGDGINDAPAIKHADVGIAMGISGSDVTKETADVVLLDDSFATVVKTVSFGRNVYRNLQRFILFQLSVNLSALLYVTVCAVLGLPSPFNTLQLLWINVIMDGPPALTLGLEQAGDSLMNNKPVKRSDGIVSIKMMVRIVFNGIFVGGVMLLQTITNFMGATHQESSACLFTLFILFQLFNAFNSRELGSESIFKSVGKNKVMVFAFVGVFVLHVLIINFLPSLFGVSTMSLMMWLKCLAVSFTIVLVVEGYKVIYRLFSARKKLKIEEKNVSVNQNSTLTA